MLVVAPKHYGEHCVFAGATTSQCGECLAQRCRAEIDTACTDDLTLAAVESCTDKHDCAAMTAPAVAGTAVATCLAANCGDVCRTLTGTSQTACSEPSLSEGTACKCTGGGATNDFVCDTKAYPDTICCAPAGGWPAEGQGCTCAQLACTTTTDGCACAVTSIAPAGATCGGGKCCVDQERCACRATGCYDGETKVDSCVIAQIGCAKGQVKVESCSVRSPP